MEIKWNEYKKSRGMYARKYEKQEIVIMYNE